MTVTAAHRAIVFSFPEVDAAATLHVTFHRTLRVPDDAITYGLPPSLGRLDVRATHEVDPRGRQESDAMLPLWQSEATWIDFTAPDDYPFLVKVGVGGINAITGDAYTPAPDFVTEDYLEVPTQPWLDGFRVDATTVRQFVAMPLGDGYSAAEQLTGTDDGLIRFSVVPLKADVWAQRPRPVAFLAEDMCIPAPAGMGLGAGGSIQQSIATPIEPHENWALDARTEARIRLVNSAVWQSITGEAPHRKPLTVDEYLAYGFPWFEWYDDSLARQGESPLNAVKTIRQIGEEKGANPLPDNTSFTPPTPHIVGGV
ncbi:hypothetical protein [Gordonia rhizosphera]|uniref:Uncharacterized protein n=1 Tax=Gordonia rhizosphera NBRC 16068 TaxID=1108045 RepID=K6VXX6_9ACTN|nr:hypothetical protein [Gordonia rhizosphera]GAB91755.1 hypothetical protein GORHZ_145_00100 [Gordonia rhizosphera NBRC 16068]